MKIPKSVKVGGTTYRVKVTNNLELGSKNYSGEIRYASREIRIAKNNNKEMLCATFLHELFHAIFDFHGHQQHDEKLIEELANALFMIIVDNPDIFSDEKKVEVE